MIPTRDQLEFPSLDFPGRTTLYPHECAERIGCAAQHIYDLIEEGQLGAINLSGANNLTDRRCLRVPIESWRKFLVERTTANVQFPAMDSTESTHG
jgi:hypothetical protein